jgi:hypothetical protein
MKYAKWLIIDAVLICVLICVWHWYWEKYIPSLSDTEDEVKLPEPYGHGSSTLKHWIEKNQKEDANPPQEGPRAQEHLGSFNIPDTVPNRVLPQQQ